MPRYRNLNDQQQARVQQQMQSGNYGNGALGQIAARRAGRIQTTPNLVTQQAPVPAAPQPAPAPMQTPAPAPRPRPMGGLQAPPPSSWDQMRPQMPTQQKPFSGYGYAEGFKSMGGPGSMQESYAQKQPGMFSPQGGAYQDRGQMAGQAIDQMRAKMPPPQPPMPYAQGQQQVEQRQFQPMQKPMGQFQGY